MNIENESTGDGFVDIVDSSIIDDGCGIDAGVESEDEFTICGGTFENYGGTFDKGIDDDDGGIQSNDGMNHKDGIDDDGFGMDVSLFDAAVGALETLLVDDAFSSAQDEFIREHCSVFEDTEENKLVYMEIYDMYTAMIEDAVEKALVENVPGFDMSVFMAAVEAREDEVSADVFDVLVSLVDFERFKALMVGYKKGIERDAAQGLTVSVCHLMEEEETEGTPRPDLNLTISPLPSPQRKQDRSPLNESTH